MPPRFSHSARIINIWEILIHLSSPTPHLRGVGVFSIPRPIFTIALAIEHTKQGTLFHHLLRLATRQQEVPHRRTEISL